MSDKCERELEIVSVWVCPSCQAWEVVAFPDFAGNPKPTDCSNCIMTPEIATPMTLVRIGTRKDIETLTDLKSALVDVRDRVGNLRAFIEQRVGMDTSPLDGPITISILNDALMQFLDSIEKSAEAMDLIKWEP